MRKKNIPTLPADTVPPEERTGGVEKIDPLVFPDLKKLYHRRLGRLEVIEKQLGENDYLSFLQALVKRQENFLVPTDLKDAVVKLLLNRSPLTLENLKELPNLSATFQEFAAPLLPLLSASIAERFLNLPADELAKQASLLLAGDFDKADDVLSLVIWNFLSSCWAQARDTLSPKEFLTENAAFTANCPCCGSLSAGALIMVGAREGLRYQQCALCEARWHKVRAVCIMCNTSESLDYWSLEDKDAPIEAESCGECKTYTKIFRLDKSADVEVVSDDIATMPLDALIEEKGFTRNGINPFALPL